MLSRRCAISPANLAMPGVAPHIVGTLGAAFEKRIVHADTNLLRSDEQLIEELASQVDKKLLAVLDSRSVDEFEKRRRVAWPQYVRALRALSDTARNFVPDEEFIALMGNAVDVFAQEFEKLRGRQFVDELIDQAQFSLWTLRRLMALAPIIDAAGQPPDERKTTDSRLNKDFRLLSLWAQFHLDITLTAMAFYKDIPAEVQREIADGMRAAVNAYAIGEEALALRSEVQPQVEPVTTHVWDAEDDELLASSMRDLDASDDDL